MLRTAEFVSKSHPDKICDQISDAILDECLRQDPDSRVAVEVMGGHGIITVTGEVTTGAYVDVPACVHSVVGSKYGVQVNLVHQSPEIASGVDTGGAGDQGVMIGYACTDTPEMMPLEYVLARDLCKYIYEMYQNDGKTQVTVNDNGEIVAVVASWCGVDSSELLGIVDGWLLKKRIKDGCYRYVNPAGKWDIGGFDADTGLTGRKIVIDAYGPRVPVGGGAFCVDGKTEFLSKEGWKNISDYKKGDLVGQYFENGEMEFVEPLYYIAESCEKMYEVIGETNISQALTENHNFVYISSKGNLNKKPFAEVMKMHNESVLGFSGRVIPFFDYNNGEKICLTDEEIRLQIAFMADGTLSHQNRVRLLKKRKIERLKELLDNAGYEYEIRIYSDGYSYFYFTPPIETKEFDFSYWIKANKKQLEIIADEIVQWDGDCDHIYRTTNKKNADFIQYVFTVINESKCSILVDDRIGESYGEGGKYLRKSICYDVYSGKTKYCTLKRKDGEKLEIKEIEPEGKMKYCFTVPSGMLVLRRDDRIFITGNSGKDPSKVDRSGAYMARKIAVDCLKDGGKECFVKLAYAIGRAEPLQAHAKISDYDGCYHGIDFLLANDDYDLTPKGIIEFLDLKKPIYQRTAESGHFGNGNRWDL